MTVPYWIRHPPAVAMDVLLTLMVGASTAALLYSPGAEDPLPEGAAFALASTLPLLVRRRWPLGVLAVVTAAGVSSPVDLPYVLPLAVAAYSLGAEADRRRTVAGLAGVLLCLLAYALAGGTRLGPADVALVGFVAGVTAAVGVWEQ